MTRFAPHGSLRHDPQGAEYWEIDGLEHWTDCLLSVVGAGDHWMYVSTSGGLSAGRRDASRRLFPYETDDRLHHAASQTGPITLIRCGETVWQPFDPRGLAPGRRRTLRKAAEGHWVEFEEAAPELGLVFRYRWTTSREFGLVRTATLEGSGHVEILDGLRNVLPADVPPLAQQGLSSLVDAYKRSEVDDAGVAIYAMEAALTDKASAQEVLLANVIWRLGLPGATVHLNDEAVRDFRWGRPLSAASPVLGRRGAYLVHAPVDLTAGPSTWTLVGEVHLDHAAVTALGRRVRHDGGLAEALEADIIRGGNRLRDLVASSDGDQHTADRSAVVHHFANVVFNTMRGGVFAHDHDVDCADVRAFVQERNLTVAARHEGWLADLPERLSHPELMARAEQSNDPQLLRLCTEYLPLVFSRRHGDPSRPWNAFRIDLEDDAGNLRYGYQGNWRDIFQNWEALCASFPHFLAPIVAKFVNASTLDGFNPYRITRDGVDWEEPNPEDPWSNIGYWGDHQIVYLFRLVELTEAHVPGSIRGMLAQRQFSAADVPYRIKPYRDLCRDAKDTIVFDEAANEAAHTRQAALGGDGRLVTDARGEVQLLTLLEKLLISVLAKLSNFVPGGGIWLNTQRPEWNDANNALVGQGLSMVTLAHLRRALLVLHGLVSDMPAVGVSEPVAGWFSAVSDALADPPAVGGPALTPEARRQALDRLGTAFDTYRSTVYATGLAGEVPLTAARVIELCERAIAWMDHTLAHNRREDGLFHSYNLLHLGPDTAEVSHLYEMLEGQVAVLGSGLLDAAGSTALLDAMFESRLFRDDQHSFLLYPFRDRAPFLERNRIEPRDASLGVFQSMVEAGDSRLVVTDGAGTLRFHSDLVHADAVRERLREVGASPAECEAVLAVYERVFDHHSFTGRSGTMYKYEGLGSIYWHMVSKLLVSVQEAWWRAHDAGEAADDLAALADGYYRVRRGLSFNKSVAEYGAVPTDPYSHTPTGMGAQQPGMTGQVKEEILTRRGELGVRILNGEISLSPVLLRRRELTDTPTTWRGVDVPEGSVAFTLCGVPVVLALGDAPHTAVHFADGRVEHIDGARLSRATSAAVFARDGQVTEIRATVPRTLVTLQ